MNRLRPKGLLSFLSVGVVLAAVGFGCSAGAGAKDEQLCKPGKYVFCRCQDRQEGAKLCNDEGDAYGPCEPCETADNPEIVGGDGSSSGDYPPIGEDDAGDTEPPKPTCGDGVVQDGEDCDDEDTDNADGCDDRCKLAGEDPPQTISCPGLEVHVWGGGHSPTIAGSTTGSGNRSTSCSPSGSTASDRVFKVVAHEKGTMQVVASDVTFDAFLYASEACPTTGKVDTLACENGASGKTSETLSFSVDAGKTYYVFVDGASGGTGGFRVTFSIQ